MPEAQEQLQGAERVAGRYVVEEVLGEGGMAYVCRVRDEVTGKGLALKRVRPSERDRTNRRDLLLRREFHTLSQLAHPRIIEVYDFGVDEVGPYYTMELLDGTDLSCGGRLAWEEACALLSDVGSSLAILHSRGLIHRDVSTRNVRKTADGRAKLFDFGAMQPMGVPRDVVGTPAFMAPEALHMQSLDPRVDLFSLGALGYYLLTGRHAYPARRMSDLRDIWRSIPAAPSRINAEVPQALSALVMELLALDRTARPQSAAAVMERLRAIGNLPAEDAGEVSRAYLAAPVFFGRESALASVRRAMLSLVRRDGGVLMVKGPAGSGRSRMLDACALEAKMLGACVVRADVTDAARGDWGVARVLCTVLYELLPREVEEAARLGRHVLAHLVPSLAGGAPEAGAMPDRGRMIRELRDFILSVARRTKLAVLVDDADHIDEPSAALVAALATKADRHALVVAVSVDASTSHLASASLRLLHNAARLVELEPLASDQTAGLMRSVFGDVANLSIVSARVHELSQGNPREAMELAQHLVDRGLARYEAGHWTLPAKLDDGDLPQSLSASLLERVEALSADAREMADVLSLAIQDSLTLRDYPALVSHGDVTRVFGALDELVAARVLVADAEHYAFSQRGFPAVLALALQSERRRNVHSRLADLLRDREGDPVRLAYHLFEAGRDHEAIVFLHGVDLFALQPDLRFLEIAAARAAQCGAPAKEVYRLRIAALSKAALDMAPAFRSAAPPVLAQLERDSGLARCRQLVHLSPAERLETALRETHERFVRTPEQERVYDVEEGIRSLARVMGAFTSMATSTLDAELLESLPSIDDLLPLSPALECVAKLVEASGHYIRGRTADALARYQEVLARIEEPDRAGLDEAQYERTLFGVTFVVGLVEAGMGLRAAERRARLLERNRSVRVNAYQVRALMHLFLGDAASAQKCTRRAEVLQLQDGLEARYAASTSGLQLRASVMAGDLLGAKNALALIASLAERHPGWQVGQRHAESQILLLQGDPRAALDHLLPGFEVARPGEHALWLHLAEAHLSAVNALGHAGEALRLADRYLEIAKRERLVLDDQSLLVEAAQAWSLAGMHGRAIAAMDHVLESAVAAGRSGLSLGILYEARARLSLRMEDYGAFQRFADKCADQYNRSGNPLLNARFARLLEEARDRQASPVPVCPEAFGMLTVSQTQSGYETVYSRMSECVDGAERARCALTMLLQNTDAFVGWLLSLEPGGDLTVLAAVPEGQPPQELVAWVAEMVELERSTSQEPGATSVDSSEDRPLEEVETRTDSAPNFVDVQGRMFEHSVLVSGHGGQRRIAAVFVRNVPVAARRIPNRLLLSTIADELVAQGDTLGLQAD